MRKDLTKAVLVIAILTFPTNVVCQHQPRDFIQGDASKTAAAGKKKQKIYQVGGDVKAPRVISSPQPSLDEEQIKKPNGGKKVAENGLMIVRIIVGEDGAVRNPKVLQSFHHDLDAKAIDTISQWKFEPALKKGVPVPVEIDVQVTFHLY